MSSKQRPPLSPADAQYVGLARIQGAEAAPVEARHLLRWPSRSRPAKEHFSSCDERGGDIRCTCEAWTYRGACGHAAGHVVTLAHFGVTFGPPPADPGGAARPDPGFATPLDPDDEGPFAGGAALDAAQAGVDGELDDWMPPYPHPLPTLDEAVELAGGGWIQSRTPAGVRLVCASCGAVRGWATEVGAIDWLATDGRCGCGGAGPTPPAPGAARRPMADLLADL